MIHGWGPVVPSGLAPEHAGVPVLALRQRLAAQGYDLPPEAGGAEPRFDPALVKTVQQFQRDHGLNPDGIVGPATLGELNKTPQDRLASVIAAMERERWMNRELGDRHVWVNLPDFSATILENGRVVLQSRAVIGKTAPALRTPEFSDLMSYLVINPSWTVPRSITVREYLPQLKANRYALPQLQVLDRRGRVLRRSAVNFSAYSARSFPYVLRQPPGADNALGRVKFMFPNAYSIYLHDTPAQALFARERRAFSHGCIRLARPQAFAHVLLGWQNEDPEAVYRRHLASGRETTVGLRVPVPVHIVYRTAFAPQSGRLQYRPDIYGRDAAVFDALTQAGVSLGAVRS